MIKIHLVFDSDADVLAQFIKNQEQMVLTGWDYSFDTAAQWAMGKKGDDPDVILINGACDIAQVDLDTGERNRDQAILKRLRDMRVGRPDSRIIILLPPEKKDGGKQFLAGLVSLSIYDIHFVSIFGKEDVLKWLHSKKSIIDVQDFLPTAEADGTDTVQHTHIAPVFDLDQVDANPDYNNTISKATVNIKDRESSTPESLGRSIKFNVSGLTIPFLHRPKNNNPVVYVSHPLITVWSPTGTNKSITALNLAVAAARAGFNSALIELDLFSPLLDIWFDVPQTGIEENVKGAGLMTFGDKLQATYITKLLQKNKWDVYYLPAGNKLGNIGTPEINVDQIELAIRSVYQRNINGQPAVTIINAGSSFEYPPTIAALGQATVIAIPYDGTPQEAELIKRQLTELERVNVKPRVVELWLDQSAIKAQSFSNYRLTIPVAYGQMLKAAADNKPPCLTGNNLDVWQSAVKELAANSW